MNNDVEKTKEKRPLTARKTAARFAAMQVLYSCDVTENYRDASALMQEFLSQNLEEAGTGDVKPDTKWFTRLVEGTCKRRDDIDALISEHLASSWTLERLDHVVRALLRVAVYELLECGDVPLKVVINEYMAITRTFFEGEELGFVNGILDTIGRKVRG